VRLLDDEKLMRRLVLWQALLVAAGLAAWYFTRGQTFAVSFLVGALASEASFWLIHKLAHALGGAHVSAFAAVMGTLRLLLIGGAMFVILRTYDLQVGAVATGISVVVVSILLEAIREALV
jgi:hypothetical protein